VAVPAFSNLPLKSTSTPVPGAVVGAGCDGAGVVGVGVGCDGSGFGDGIGSCHGSGSGVGSCHGSGSDATPVVKAHAVLPEIASFPLPTLSMNAPASTVT